MKGDNPFLCAAFSPDAKLIASGCGGFLFANTVQLWNVQKMKAAANPFIGHDKLVNSVQFSPDGTRVVSGSEDQTIRIWDVERGTPVVRPLKGHTQSVCSVAFSPDGSQIVASSKDRTVSMWDAREGRLMGNPYEAHTHWVNSVAFSPRGTYVISGGYDKTVRLWDIRTGRQVDQPFEEHTDAVESVAFSPCGQYAASGSRDSKVIIRSIFANSSESNDLDSCMASKDEQSLIESETMHINSHMSVQHMFEPSKNLDSRVASEDEARLLLSEATQIDSHMSTQQMFECLIGVGCIDLSPQMNTKQDTAMIMSGGGFGDIRMGQLYDGTKVAIKAWRTEALEELRYKTLKRAARELFYWSRLCHKNIHQLMGVIVFRDEYLGMVSEWMENGDLRKYIRKHPSADRRQLCVDVASGLEYMHSQHMANVLVSSDGIARLSDFDFSVMSAASNLIFTESSNTRTGTVRWLAPEMLLEEAPKRTTESDVYALGMEIFTGNVPYPECQKDYFVMKKVEQGTLPTRPTEQLGKDQRGDAVWQLMLSCWSRKLDERPSAGRVVEVVRRFVHCAASH
ncbi:tyrosine kinase family catalytic domain protein [Rhizoctonia solani 123E]|uniref:Tyrosine kinase family catalytic domain protein n=1 Tax=Rhizoctonia solani 123E TaxID=1423351 RepID=A0A074RL46_9AGAM|nr:tyrosine kinase family catalytic domain protein [Rhizoctonia solani 123E]